MDIHRWVMRNRTLGTTFPMRMDGIFTLIKVFIPGGINQAFPSDFFANDIVNNITNLLGLIVLKCDITAKYADSYQEIYKHSATSLNPMKSL